MSSNKRRVVERFTYPDFTALVYDTTALQVFYRPAAGYAKATAPVQEGLHIATLTQTTPLMREQGWLALIIEGIMDLYRHPATVRREESAWSKDDRLVIDYSETTHRAFLELAMTAPALTPADRVATFASAVGMNVALPSADLSHLSATGWRLATTPEASVYWGNAYQAFLLPAFALARTGSPLTTAGLRRFSEERDARTHFALHQFLAQPAPDLTFQAFMESEYRGPEVQLSLSHDHLAFLQEKLALVVKPSALNPLTRNEVERFLTYFLTAETAPFMALQADRLKRGVRVRDEDSFPVHLAPFPQAGRVLTDGQFRELEQALAADGDSCLHNCRILDGHLGMAFLFLIAEQGVSRGQDFITELAKGSDLYSMRMMNYRLKKKRELRKVLRLLDPAYHDVPVVLALPLVELVD